LYILSYPKIGKKLSHRLGLLFIFGSGLAISLISYTVASDRHRADLHLNKGEFAMIRDFHELIGCRWEQGLFLCVGLDSAYARIPVHITSAATSTRKAIVEFNCAIVDATCNVACCYKPNIAFYEAEGTQGLEALADTIQYIQSAYSHIPVILDAKRGDIGATNAGYVRAIFDEFLADATTVHPYLGKEALAPFLARKEKGIFVLCRTSNKGADEFQDLMVDQRSALYEVVAEHIADSWNKLGNCGLVVGATYPEQIGKVRTRVGDNIPLLIPGIGTQGGDLENSVRLGLNRQGTGIIVNASSSVIFASRTERFAAAAHTESELLHRGIEKAVTAFKTSLLTT